MTDVRLRSGARFTCPFCGGQVALGELEIDGEIDSGVTHEMPPCAKFMSLNIIEFVRACRLAMSAS